MDLQDILRQFGFPLATHGTMLRDQWVASVVRCSMQYAERRERREGGYIESGDGGGGPARVDLPQLEMNLRRAQCAVCQKMWPLELLWSGATCGERRPSYCPPCHRRLQRWPSSHCRLQSLSVLVRGVSETALPVPVEDVLMRAHDPYWHQNQSPKDKSMVVQESVVTLGGANCAVRLQLRDESSVYRVLRSAIPNCNIDYLPVAPESGPYCVKVSAARPNSHLPTSVDLVGWFTTAGGCSVVAASSRNSRCAVLEMADVKSWEAALALNGEMLPCEHGSLVVSVVPGIPASNGNVEASISSPSYTRLQILQLRALKGIPKAARRVVLSYLPLQLLVPGDCSLEDAFKQRPESIFLSSASSASHYLPHGVRITEPVELVGDGCGAELQLGGPIIICSTHGTLLRNVTFKVAEDVEKQPAALLRVNSSHVEAVCWASLKVSDGLKENWTRKPFAVCSGLQPVVRIEDCKFVGGRHAIDARGSVGLHQTSRWKSDHQGFDVASWLLKSWHRCANDVAEEVPLQFATNTDVAYFGCWPEWASHRCTHLQLRRCEIHSASEEALHVWRGAHVEMAQCHVHHCGSGITVAHSDRSDAGMQLLEQRPSWVTLEDNRFEDLSTHAWSAAAAVGCLTLRSDLGESSQRLVSYRDAVETGQSATRKIRSFCPIHLTLRRNTVSRCSMGFQACQVTVVAEGNQLNELHLGGFHFRDCHVNLVKNQILNVKGTGISLCAEEKLDCSNILRTNILRFCTLGIRMSSKVLLSLVSSEDKIEENKDAISIQGPGCTAAFDRCTVRGSQRCGLYVERKAAVTLEDSEVVGNGRGVAVGDGSINVQRCHFEDNVGWAVRLEGPPGLYANQPSGSSQDADVTISEKPMSSRACRHSVITSNTFGSVSRGNVGRKRVRVDVWHSDSVDVEDNEGADGEGPIEPLRKRRREDDAIEEDAALQFANLSLRS